MDNMVASNNGTKGMVFIISMRKMFYWIITEKPAIQPEAEALLAEIELDIGIENSTAFSLQISDSILRIQCVINPFKCIMLNEPTVKDWILI